MWKHSKWDVPFSVTQPEDKDVLMLSLVGLPNVLLVVVDCLRADHCPVGVDDGALRCWPRLCREGGVFSQMISAATNTLVSFSSILTGLYPFAHGIYAMRTTTGLAPDLPMLQGVLKQAGYVTFARVTGPLIDALGVCHGFDDYQHRLRTRSMYTDWGRSLLEELSGDGLPRPWFMLLHLFEVHRPRQLGGLSVPRDPGQEYDLAWRQLDAKIEEILGALGNDTMVVLTGDHGESYRRRSDVTWPGHLGRKLREWLGLPRRPQDWRNHGFHVFDELIRVPLAIRGPGVPAGCVVDTQARHIDLLPTLLDLLGQDCPPGVQGRSLVPALQGKPLEEIPAYVVSGSEEPGRHRHGLRHRGWKYAERPRWGRRVDLCPMLFNLYEDPHERRNVARARPDVVSTMRQQIDELIYGDGVHSPRGRALSAKEQTKLQQQLRALGYI